MQQQLLLLLRREIPVQNPPIWHLLNCTNMLPRPQ
jgi:hypothetical protein